MRHDRSPDRVTAAASLALALACALPGTVVAACGYGPVRAQLTAGPPRVARVAPRAAAAHVPGPRSAEDRRDDRDAVPAVAALGESFAAKLLGREPDVRHRRRPSEQGSGPHPSARTRGTTARARDPFRAGGLADGEALFHEAHAPPVLSSLAVARNQS